MPDREIPPLPTLTRTRARALRHESTSEERLLWYRLRSGRLGGHKFRRQHAIPPYIVDFCCLTAGLVVELDGGQHGDGADAERDSFLERHGYRVIRFSNNQVTEQIDAVLEVILAAAQDPTLTPGPSPTGRGESSQGE